MIVVQLNHWDGSSSEVNVSADARFGDLASAFSVESVEILSVKL